MIIAPGGCEGCVDVRKLSGPFISLQGVSPVKWTGVSMNYIVAMEKVMQTAWSYVVTWCGMCSFRTQKLRCVRRPTIPWNDASSFTIILNPLTMISQVMKHQASKSTQTAQSCDISHREVNLMTVVIQFVWQSRRFHTHMVSNTIIPSIVHRRILACVQGNVMSELYGPCLCLRRGRSCLANRVQRGIVTSFIEGLLFMSFAFTENHRIYMFRAKNRSNRAKTWFLFTNLLAHILTFPW